MSPKQLSSNTASNVLSLCKPGGGGHEGTVGVLLLHGLTGTPSEMKSLVKHLTKRGYQVSCPLLPGHGAGHKELLKTRWQDWLQGSREAFEELKKTCDQVYVVGLSMSCLLATLIAAERNDVAGICLLSVDMGIASKETSRLRVLLPLAMRIPILRNYLYWREKSPYGIKDERMQRMITKSIESAKKGETQDFGLFRTYLGSLYQNHLLTGEVKRRAAETQCPALILHSTEDTILSHENAVLIHKLLGSPDKKLQLIDGCDHVMTVDLKKREVAQMVDDFITQHSRLQNKAVKLAD